MNTMIEPNNSLYKNRWRIIGWGGAMALLLTPLIAMQFTPEVNWSAGDFIFAAMMFGTVGLLIELAVRVSENGWYRAGVALAVLSALIVVWVNGAVGMIGNEGNPTNLLFFVSIAIALFGAVFTRFRAPAMAWPMLAAGAWQAGVGTVMGIFGTDMRGGIFTLILSGSWFLSGLLLRNAKE